MSGEGLDQPMAETVAATAPALEPLPVVAPGQVIGRHVVLSKLGAGAMGVVYAAYDPELDRKVAIKVLRPGTGGSIGRQRLLREAQALAKLGHENVVSVHDVGEHNGQVWLAMEFIDGCTLTDWLAQQPRHWREVLEVTRAAGRGLEAAHLVGLVHRDFKPDNVMVAKDGRVRVTDFGLARTERAATRDSGMVALQSDHRGSQVELTDFGSLVGTPAYMAPEQYLGQPADAKSDQFSFCVTAWQALCGERPFAGENVHALAFAITQGKLREPTRGNVPGWLRKVLARGLSGRAEERWTNMGTLLQALASGHARAKRRRTMGSAMMLGLAAAAAMGWARFDEQRRIAACNDDATAIAQIWSEDVRRSLQEAMLATKLSFAADSVNRVLPWLDQWSERWSDLRRQTCLQSEVERSLSASVASQSAICLEAHKERLAGIIAVMAEGRPESVARAVPAIMSLPQFERCSDPLFLQHESFESTRVASFRSRFEHARGLEALGRPTEAAVLTRELLGEAEAANDREALAQLWLFEGTVVDDLGQLDDSETALGQAFTAAGPLGFDEIAADAAIGLVLTVGVQSARPAEGRIWGQVAEMLLAQSSDLDSLRAAGLWNNLGLLYQAASDWDRAEAFHRKALAIRSSLLGPHHIVVAGSLNNLAVLQLRRGDEAAARPLLEQVLAIREETLGPEHPQVAHILSNLADWHAAKAEWPEAQVLYERALAILERALGQDNPGLAIALGNLAQVRQQQGELDAAEVLATRAVVLDEAALGRNHPDLAFDLCILAGISLQQGQLDRAEGLYRRALELRESALGKEAPFLFRPLLGLGQVEHARKRSDRARPFLQRALAIAEAGKLDPADVAEIQLALAEALWPHDRFRAASLARSAVSTFETAGPGKRELLAEARSWIALHDPAPAKRQD